MRSSKTRLPSARTWLRCERRAVMSDPAAKKIRAMQQTVHPLNFQQLSVMEVSCREYARQRILDVLSCEAPGEVQRSFVGRPSSCEGLRFLRMTAAHDTSNCELWGAGWRWFDDLGTRLSSCSLAHVVLHALESLFKLRDERGFAGLKTVASHDAPEKIAVLVRIVHGQKVF